VFEVQPPQEWIRSDLCGAENIPPPIGLDFSEGKQFPDTSVEVAPYPPVNRPHHPVHTRSEIGNHLTGRGNPPALMEALSCHVRSNDLRMSGRGTVNSP
jgi:hypothetical protein